MRELEALVRIGREMERVPMAGVRLAKDWLLVRDRQGRMCSLKANAAQLAFEAGRGRQNIVLKARQMGITTWVAGRFFLRTITRPGTLTVQVAHTRASAEAIYATVERMWQGLPNDLRDGPLRRSRANAGQMVFAEIGSEFRAWSAGDENAGRGLSIQNLHCSEVSRWPGDAAGTLAGLRAALAPDGELVLESTANGAYGAFYEEWGKAGSRDQGTGIRSLSGLDVQGPSDAGCVAALASRNTRVPSASSGQASPLRCASVEMTGFGGRAGEMQIPCGNEEQKSENDIGLVRCFLPWWMEPAYEGYPVAAGEMTDEERGLRLRHGLSAEQIGFRRGLERTFGVLRAQEFAEDAESCFRGTGDCCFDPDAIERRMAELEGVKGEPWKKRRGGALWMWMPYVEGKEYVVAVDSAGGGADGDFAAVQVVERETGLQCAELQERLRPAALANVVAELAREFGGALIAVERNNHGAAVLAYLETSERYGRLYRQHGEAGWLTTAASKPEMVARLSVVLSEAAPRLMSRRLLRECRTFVSGERGRSGAASGAHDDLVMSMAMAQAVRAEVLEGGGRRGPGATRFGGRRS